MNVGKRISAACALLVLLTVAVAGIALYRVADILSKLRSITEQSLPGMYTAGKLAQINRTITGNILLHVGMPSEHKEMESKIGNGQKQFTELLDQHGKSVASVEEKGLYNAIPPAYRRLSDAWDRIRVRSNAADSAAAWQLWMTEGRPAMLDLEQKLNAEIDFARSNGDRNGDATTKSVASAQAWIWALLLLSVVSGGGLAFYIVRGLNLQLRKTARDLSAGAKQVARAASSVASSSQSLAQGATEQAASLQETSASTEEITSMTRQTVENTRSAAAAMRAVDLQVEEGNRTLGEMLISMSEIRQAGDEISKIVKIIDQIAFQTNILALNAAVEAARAGEAGMGFAVVAGEVRNLAQRSAQAAKETAVLIEDSVSKSKEGVARVERVAGVIGTITESTTRAKTLITAVHQCSDEQARGVEQIAKAIAQMDLVTQSTASNAEESAAGSQQLSAQAATLNEVVMGLERLVGSR